MERKDDAIIRRKVQGLESEPVVLDRERLWSSISFPGVRHKRSALIYYAAASVALAWALVFLIQELSRRDQLQVRMLELEWSIQSEITKAAFVAAVTPSEVPCETPVTIDDTSPPKRTIHHQTPARKLVAEVREPIFSISEEKPIAGEPIPTPEPLLVAAQPAAQPRVVLGASLPDNTSVTRKRLRVGLFREEERPTSPSAPLVTLAGVNNQ